ncbi:CDC48 family AAA ATPase [Sporolituus thermophilus]|uniref:Transitional endoplasmic reticulum ATPase n=1 Tax=Sporolituus thermophilus DSM 23256 TaxID=1123285 RepID=A0A1G7LHU7_9FIRM|nr:CDC48 family AAA ATPase [Sporolituus thermophilus]SDF49013.1 transitional endoplasmic reticulum ATPase [Sporolituus thermophilus DSM 23256]
MNAKEVLTFRVADAMPEDVGQGYVRLDNDDMAKLGVIIGDIVEIQGRKTTVAKVVPCYSHFKKQNLVQMEAIIRQNAGVGIDERVTIRKVAHKPCNTLVLSPLDTTIDFSDAQDIRHLERLLNGLPVIIGDKLKVTLAGARAQYFTVIGTSPQGPVVINAATKITVTKPDVQEDMSYCASYEDVGGLDKELQRIREMIELPLKYPEVFRQLGVDAPKGVLLYGPPGTGKTLMARAVASESRATFLHVNGPEIVNKFYGESEARLRELFETAQRRAPSIIFIDEIDAIAPKRSEVIGDVEKRIVAQLLALMDGLKSRGEVIVIGATNVPDMVDPALRRPGRFDRELSINPPDMAGRLAILKIHTRSMRLDPSVDLERIAQMTHGFVGADLAILCKEAGMNAIRRILPELDLREEGLPPESLAKLRVTADDFLQAFREVEPTATREFFADRPNIGWQHVGGLADIKEKLRSLIELPLSYPELFRRTRQRMPKGVLLTGPPGTGKTLIVRALAGSSGAHLIAVDASTLHSRWLGEAEKGLRQIFKRAKQVAPCILFFDEIDALAPVRSGGDRQGVGRLVSQLLLELDNLMDTANVIVIGATNRPDMLDPALLRAGRLDYRIELPKPNSNERLEIFKIHTEGVPLAADVDLPFLAERTDGLVGSDIEAICKHATLAAIKRYVAAGHRSDETGLAVQAADFAEAINEVVGCSGSSLIGGDRGQKYPSDCSINSSN